MRNNKRREVKSPASFKSASKLLNNFFSFLIYSLVIYEEKKEPSPSIKLMMDSSLQIRQS